MHVLKIVYFPITTVLKIYLMNNQSIQVSSNLLYYGVSLKTVFKLNYFFKRSIKLTPAKKEWGAVVWKG